MNQTMFERFTDRARRVVVLAQEEARLLNHNYIGTEHMLLGLIHEGEGVAAKALESLGISLEAVRAQVEEIIGQGQSAPTGHIPFTPRAKKVFELSLREALQLGHNYIGTEHILLGLVREGEGVAAQVLVKLGADLARVRQQVIQVLSGYAGGEDVGTRGCGWSRMTVPDDLREAEEQLAQVRRGEGGRHRAGGFRAGRGAARRRKSSSCSGWPSGSGNGPPGWTWPRSSRKTTSSTARSSGCGSCLVGTGSTQTVGPRRPPEPPRKSAQFMLRLPAPACRARPATPVPASASSTAGSARSPAVARMMAATWW